MRWKMRMEERKEAGTGGRGRRCEVIIEEGKVWKEEENKNEIRGRGVCCLYRRRGGGSGGERVMREDSRSKTLSLRSLHLFLSSILIHRRRRRHHHHRSL